MTTKMSANGSGRKTLAEQIDRLDSILDGLSENLSEAVTAAVAGAVKEVTTAAIHEAVRAAVVEVLKDAARQKQFVATQLPANESIAPVPVRLVDMTRRCWGWLVGAARDAWDTITTVANAAMARVLEAGRHILVIGRAKAQQVRKQLTARAQAGWLRLLVVTALARQLRRRLLASVGVGVAVGVLAYLAGPLVVPVAFGLAGFVASMMVGGRDLLRQRVTTPEAGGG